METPETSLARSFIHSVEDALVVQVESCVSPEARLIGFTTWFDGQPTGVAWVYLLDLCSAVAGAFALSIIGVQGAPLGDEWSWERRRSVTELAGGFHISTRGDNDVDFWIRGDVQPPAVSRSWRGNPIVHPVNDRAYLTISIDDVEAQIDPRELLAALIEQGVVIRFDDWQRVFSRHEQPAIPAFEVWPNGRTTAVSV